MAGTSGAILFALAAALFRLTFLIFVSEYPQIQLEYQRGDRNQIRGKSVIVGLTGLAFLASHATRGQVPATLEFEVASVKPHPGPVTISGLSISGTRVGETAVNLLDLVTDAYNVRYDQVSDGPNWGKGEVRYDIQAKAPGGREPSREQVRQMLQSLLANRFKLVIHRETTEIPVYALVLAKGGTKLKPSNDPTGVRVWANDNGRHMEGSVNMEFLIRQLSSASERPVVDQTGLAGNFTITLEWTPDNFTPADTTASLSIFTAVQEQLGLKLEPAKASVEKLIIEHAEKPGPD